MDWSTKEANELICNALSEALIENLSLERCRLHWSSNLVAALVAMRDFYGLLLSKLQFVDQSLALFLTGLASELSGMPERVELACDPWRPEAAFKRTEEDAFLLLVKTAVCSPLIRRLWIHPRSFPQELDDALTEGVRTNNQLHGITVQCPDLLREEAHYPCPALCQA